MLRGLAEGTGDQLGLGMLLASQGKGGVEWAAGRGHLKRYHLKEACPWIQDLTG